MYKDIKKILSLAVGEDDLISQENLFELQEQVIILALKIAQKENKVEDLVNSYKCYYTVG